MNVLIIGAGDIGFQLGKQLLAEGHNIIMIENDPHRVTRASEQLDALVLEGNGASYRRLKRAGLENIDILCGMTDRDEVNILACMIGHKSGIPTTIARIRNPEFGEPGFILNPRELGIDLIIHPEKETADAIIRLIRQSSATDVVEFENGRIQLVGIRLEEGAEILRIPLKDLWEQSGNPPIRIVAIQRKQHTIIPRGDDVLVAGDQIFVVSDPDYLETFLKHAGKKQEPIRNVMILGGGLIGQFIARELSQEVNVKIIESNVDKSQEIADLLPNTLIIHGDGTDLDLLAMEGIMDMDVFIAVTGDDETNIIATLVARHLKVPRTIALVNKVEYLPITPTIGMDAVVSKQLLTVNAVRRFIRQKEVESVNTLPGIDAEVIEFSVHEKSKITRKPLAKLHFPRHALIGAIIRNEQMIIPRGDTEIRPGDRVIVFTLPHVRHNVEKFFRT